MPKYRIEESRPDWYKGLGPVYQIHDESGPIRELKWDYEPTAIAICDDLNNGRALLAEIHYKLNGKQVDTTGPIQFTENEDVVYFFEEEKLPKEHQGAKTTDEKRKILREAGYSEIVIHWESIPPFE